MCRSVFHAHSRTQRSSSTIIYSHHSLILPIEISCSTRPVLHRIGFARSLMLHLKDLPETATAQEVHQLETVGAHLPTDPKKNAKTQRKSNKKTYLISKVPNLSNFLVSITPVLSFKAPLFGRRHRPSPRASCRGASWRRALCGARSPRSSWRWATATASLWATRPSTAPAATGGSRGRCREKNATATDVMGWKWLKTKEECDIKPKKKSWMIDS